MNYQQQQQMNMQQMNQQQDSMGMHDPSGGYQQPLYLSGPDHGIVNPSYHSPQPQPNYAMSPGQQQQHNNQLLMMQQQQQQQMMMNHGQPPPGAIGQYNASPTQGRGNSPPAAPGQEPTTSEDSDDSTPHPAMVSKIILRYLGGMLEGKINQELHFVLIKFCIHIYEQFRKHKYAETKTRACIKLLNYVFTNDAIVK